MAQWQPVARLSELVEGRGAVIERPGGCLAVFLVQGRVHVLENRCPHRDGDLGAGDVAGGVVYCPLHAWPFDLATGQSPRYASARVRVFPSRIQGDMVEAELEDPPASGDDEPVDVPEEYR